MTAESWLSRLGRLGPADLKRTRRLVDALVAAPVARRETAHVMLDACPEPATVDDARSRADAVADYLERKPVQCTERENPI